MEVVSHQVVMEDTLQEVVVVDTNKFPSDIKDQKVLMLIQHFCIKSRKSCCNKKVSVVTVGVMVDTLQVESQAVMEFLHLHMVHLRHLMDHQDTTQDIASLELNSDTQLQEPKSLSS